MTTEASGVIVSIWTKRAHRGPMDRVESADLVAGAGLRGSADQGGKRQITIISEGSWDDAQEELGVEVNPSARRANVLVRGVNLEDSDGKLLRLGGCVIRIYGETRPCHLMDEAQEGLRAALKSTGGEECLGRLWKAARFGWEMRSG